MENETRSIVQGTSFSRSKVNLTSRITNRIFEQSNLFEREISSAPLWYHTLVERARGGSWGRHDGCVNTVSWSDDGVHIITGSDDREIAIWNCAAPATLNSIDSLVFRWNSGHRGNVFSAKLLSRSLSIGSYLASCAADGRVLLHCFTESEDGKVSKPLEPKELVQHRGRAHKLALASYSRFASAGEDGKIFLFDIREGKCSTTPFYDGAIGINIIDFSPTESHYLLSGGNDEIVRVFDIRKPAIERSGGIEQPIPIMRFSPDHLRRPSEEDKTSQSRTRISNNRAHITGAQWSKNGEMIVATYNDDHAYLFRVKARAGQPASSQVQGDENTLPLRRPFSSSLFSVAFGGSSQIPLVPSVSSPVSSLRPILSSTFENTNENEVNTLKITPGVTQLINGEDCLVDLPSSEPIQSESSESIQSTSFVQVYKGQRNEMTVKGIYFMGNKSEYVITGCDSGHLFIFNTLSGKIEAMLLADSRGAVNCVAPHPRGLPIILSCGLDTRAKLFGPGRVGRQKMMGTVAEPSFDRRSTVDKGAINEVVSSNQRKRESGEPGEGLGGERSVISIGGRLISIPALIARVMSDTSGGSESVRTAILRSLLSITGGRNRDNDDDDDDEDEDEDEDEEEDDDENEDDEDDDNALPESELLADDSDRETEDDQDSERSDNDDDEEDEVDMSESSEESEDRVGDESDGDLADDEGDGKENDDNDLVTVLRLFGST
jgi:WD40 repeat protein